MMKCYNISVCSIMLASFCWYADCVKERRAIIGMVQLIASRLDLEKVARQQDTADILDRLNYLELQLNESSNNFQCSNTGQPGNIPTSTKQTEAAASNGHLLRLMKAFTDEKQIIKTLQKQVREMKSTDKLLGNLTNAVETIRDEMCTPADIEPEPTIAKMEEMLTSIKMELTEKFDNMSEEVENKLLTSCQDLESETNDCNCTKTCEPGNDPSSTREIIEQFNKLSEAVQNLSAKFDEMAVNIVKSTPHTIGKMTSCLGYYKDGGRLDDVYTVFPLETNAPVNVYCDMTTDGGGWTVFQRRKDGSVDFLRDWQDYKQGFGTLTGEFWLGNENIAALTSTGGHELRIELEDFDDVNKYAKYGKFKVLPESDYYKLEVSLYSGNANDSLIYHNGMKFTTKDNDNDNWSSVNCAKLYKGGWWYKDCHRVNLNGLYLKGPNTASSKGVNWESWRGYGYSLKMTEMKLR